MENCYVLLYQWFFVSCTMGCLTDSVGGFLSSRLYIRSPFALFILSLFPLFFHDLMRIRWDGCMGGCIPGNGERVLGGWIDG